MSHNPWDQVLLSLSSFQSLTTDQQLRYLITFAVLAPTSHNSIPQRFRVNDVTCEIECVLDRAFVLAQSDRVGRQAMVSMGCVIESLVLAAQWYGLESKVSYVELSAKSVYPLVEGQEQYISVARIHFHPTQSGQAEQVAETLPWPEIMLSRKVIRSEYDRTQTLTSQHESTLHAVASQVSELVQVHTLTGTIMLRALGKFQEYADRFVMENQRFARELGDWLLPNNAPKPLYAMRGVEFGFDDKFALTVHQGLSGLQRLLPDQVAAFAKGGKVGIESSAAVAILTLARDDQEGRMEAGRAYLRLALWLWHEGFATAVHAGITEVDWVTTMFGASVLRTSRRPVVVFRIGKPKRSEDWQRPHSLRPPVSECLLPAS